MRQRMIMGTLCLALLFSASGCTAAAQSTDLMNGIQASGQLTDMVRTEEETAAIADFEVTLFQNSISNDANTLVSPLSVLLALAMTANGAKGATLLQMEQTFGLSVEELNHYLMAYVNSLPSSSKYRVSVANSIWLREDDKLTVEQDFLQTNADYYGASVYQAAFDDTTLRDINSWVSDNTDGMIESILDEIQEEAVMYLINALAFDAEWETIYQENQVRAGNFTAQSGETQDAEMMYSTENRYLDDGSATGFIKYYADRQYAFAALLPNEGVSIDEYIASLTGKGLMDTLHNTQITEVKTAIPKFETEYSVEMSDILKSMGMTDAFDGSLADFTELGQSSDGNILISRVLHKTYIAVDEKGTKAGAVTVIEMDTGSAPPLEEPKTVYLDHPFVYMLIDCETNLPFFIGTTVTIG